MRRGEGAIERRCRQGAAVDLDHRHVDVPSRVQALPPEAFSPVVQRNRETRRLGQVVRVDVQLDLDAVGKMPARLVEQHMPAGHQKQPLAAREEKTTRVGQCRCCSKVQMRAAERRMLSSMEHEILHRCRVTLR
jgi:hypothetical protein